MSNVPERRFPRYKPAVAAINVRCKAESCGYEGYAARRGKAESIPFLNWISSYYCCFACGGKQIEAIQPKPEADPAKRESLRLLYGQFSDEITRYRDYEWKIVLWSLGLSWGAFAGSNLNVKDVFLDSVFIAVILLGALLLCSHLLFVHGELTTNRNWREQTRRLLGIYGDSGPFLPSWNRYIHGFDSGRDDFVIPFMLFMILSATGSSYLIASKYPVPRFIQNAGELTTQIWCWWPLLLIAVLLLYACRYVFLAIKNRTQKNLLDGYQANRG